MARLPSDSFLPSGALDNKNDISSAFSLLGTDSKSSSSVISPLSLPRGATSHYFDAQVPSHPHSNHHNTAAALMQQQPQQAQQHQQQAQQHQQANLIKLNGPGGFYSPRSPALGPTSHPQPPQYLSPHMNPTSTQIHYQIQQQQQQQQQRRQQQRSASLSPTRRAASLGGTAMGRTRSAMASPSRMPSSIMLPLDGTLSGMSSMNGVNGMNGMNVKHGSLPSMAISAASFGSAGPQHGPSDVAAMATIIQQLKQQNKVIREAWENERKYLEVNRSRAEEVYREERAIMDAERSEWESLRAALMDRIRQLEENASRSTRGRFQSPARIDEETALSSVDGITELRGGRGWEHSPESQRSSESSRAYTHFGNVDTALSTFQARISPPSSLTSAPFLSSLQPAPTDFLASETMDAQEADGTPVPTVDIQVIHPELEGIPIKANAMTKSTFEAPSISPPASKESSSKPSPPAGPQRPDLKHKSSSKEQTLQVLAAAEDRRLTMHAGHTPNHSLSMVPTAQSTQAPTTASSSGEVTPTTLAAADGNISTEMSDTQPCEPVEPPTTVVAVPGPVDDEPILEPVDDVELKGPLMVRNIPAKDEIFFRRLSEKLEVVIQSHEAPTVLKTLSPDAREDVRPEASTQGVEVGTDGAADEVPSPGGSQSTAHEVDIPLKLKQSNNFGAPFGAVRTYAF